MRGLRKRTAFFVVLGFALFLFLVTASAELSTNLQLRTDVHPKTKRILTQTYTDAFGSAVIADDKGYAT